MPPPQRGAVHQALGDIQGELPPARPSQTEKRGGREDDPSPWGGREQQGAAAGGGGASEENVCKSATTREKTDCHQGEESPRETSRAREAEMPESAPPCRCRQAGRHPKIGSRDQGGARAFPERIQGAFPELKVSCWADRAQRRRDQAGGPQSGHCQGETTSHTKHSREARTSHAHAGSQKKVMHESKKGK